MADVLRRTPPGFVITEFSSFPPKNRAAIAEKVAKLEKKVFPAIEHFNYDVELKKKNIGLLLVFKESDADTLAAYLVYQRMKRIAWLHKLCVVEQEREKGLGKSLIHSLRRHMEKGGCHTIFFAMVKFLAYMPFLPLLACATPQVNYPLNLQYPPVARIGAPFSFQFAPTTFSSTSENLQYSLVGNPSWLSLDGDSRTLSGTPQSDDIGTASFKINAAGQGGAVASMDSQLLISAADEPTAKDDVSAALSAVGEASRHNTVTVKPSKPFNISFPSDTFDSHGIALSYFALLENRTPLPAWISFDSSSISFGGTTSPTTYPQTIQMVLITSEAPGFSASTVSFTMVVSEHTLVFKPSSQSINVAQGQSVQINDLKKDLFLDGSNVDGKDLHSVTAELPFWLGLNNDTITITGTAPTQLKWQDIVVTAKAQSGDIAEYTVHVNVQSKTTMGDVGPLNLTLGTVPTNFTPQGVQCSLRAVSDQGSNTDSQTFQIMVSKAATTDPQNTPGSTNSWEHSNDRRKTAIIVGAVIGGIFGVIILVAFAVCLKRRRRLAKSYVSPKLPRSPRKSEISQPIFMPWHECDDTVEQNDEKNKENHDPFVSRTPEHPPRLDLNLPKYCFHGSVDLSGNNQQSTTTTNRHQSAMAGTHTSRSHTHSPHLLEEREDGHSLAGPIGDDDMRTLDHFQTSSFGIYDDTAPSQHSPDSMRIPTELAKRASQSSDTFRKHKRRTTTVHQDQIHRSTGLPVNRRITGMGHGRHTYSLSRTNTNFSSLHRPQSTGSNATTRRTSTLSITPSAFPQSPLTRKHTTLVTTPTEVRRSVRVVPASRRSSFVGGRTVGEKRNSYIRKRASNQSPFFSAGARASTCSYKSPPAFITEATSTPRSPLSPRNRNTVVRPDDDVGAGAEKDITDTPKLGELFGDQAGSPKFKFPGSLRKNRVNRPHTATSPPRDRVVKSYVRPGTAISSDRGSIVRRASTRHSFRVYDLKASLNDLTGSKVFEDAEMSDNVYSDEERDIEETEKRETIKPNEYTLPPLNLDKVDTTRNEKRGSKTAKRNSQSNTK
ncbi:He-PIG domain-containing protein [Pyrenophora tritici-repentis]|nr:He-PIG domain-containing protein [Pyrenophora tritici-repentis]KAI0589569.1 He-PIG domain-containing protein [Pyrenophora tritici-repentis]KAI0612836.1 He-PIG domain-containing protein [Pyrenophora tritici-repentis]KAI0625088.1 He-PIG domain-containing protein [Pyrenophora tritici-repentis]KAI1543045.1 CADG domain containing protein [Pyrenophora tritici-repentis]